METQKNSQIILRKKNRTGDITLPEFRLQRYRLQRYSHQNIVLAQKQTHRSMEQN